MSASETDRPIATADPFKYGTSFQERDRQRAAQQTPLASNNSQIDDREGARPTEYALKSGQTDQQPHAELPPLPQGTIDLDSQPEVESSTVNRGNAWQRLKMAGRRAQLAITTMTPKEAAIASGLLVLTGVAYYLENRSPGTVAHLQQLWPTGDVNNYHPPTMPDGTILKPGPRMLVK